MCGIAGIFAYHEAAREVDRTELRRIRDNMAARGPDGKGEWYSEDGRLALGHRRLSIIDLSERGAQPMVSADGKLVIAFNGEIYNYRALRQRLESKGHIFRSDSDTEVLLHLYAEKGADLVDDLRGMFAFAIWDADRRALLLARDPYGIKPLYYADDERTLRFASQVKALLAGGRVSHQPEPAGMVGFYLFGSIPEPFTLYREVRSVPAGNYLRIGAAGPGEPVPFFSAVAIWREAERNPVPRERDKQSAVREALLDSVRHHMVADVPVGAFLSAGIDSGAIVGLMQEVLDHSIAARAGAGAGASRTCPKLSTITLAFSEYHGTSDDEAPLAAAVAAHYGTRHRTRAVSEAEFADDLPKILRAMDQPTVDGINTWFVSKAASEAGLKVAVSGLGGDELFGGYPSFRDIPRWVRLLWLPGHIPGLSALSEQVQALFTPLFSSLNPKAAGMFRYGGTYAGAYLLRRGLFLPNELSRLLDPDLVREGLRRLRPLDHIATALKPHRPRGGVVTAGAGAGAEGSINTAFAQVSVLESALYMRNQLLRDTDWASMAHSLEVRVPLVDAWLLRACAKWLVHAKGANRKGLLANSPGKPLPAEVATRTKSGFTTPIGGWQQRGISSQAWREIPVLARDNCPWARRWGYSVAAMEIGKCAASRISLSKG